jgi:hypothetical protein
MIQTLVLSPRITPDSQMMLDAATQMNQSVMRLPNYRPPSELKDKRIALYGEPLFAIAVASGLNHALIEPTYHWLTTLPSHYLRREIVHTTMDAARRLTTPRFIKIADGMKGFPARVYASGAELPSADMYPDDVQVLVAEPVAWDVEYRCFVLDRQVVTMSMYVVGGEIAQSDDGTWQSDPVQDEEARVFCQGFLDDSAVALPPAVVVDVGRIQGRGWAVIEANPAYGSGVYGCDPLHVLAVVNRACVPRADLMDADRQWVQDYQVDFD